jgi:hypothetical protein
MYLTNGGTLEHAQQVAADALPKTTKLYERTADTMSLDKIERIVDLTGPTLLTAPSISSPFTMAP